MCRYKDRDLLINRLSCPVSVSVPLQQKYIWYAHSPLPIEKCYDERLCLTRPTVTVASEVCNPYRKRKTSPYLAVPIVDDLMSHSLYLQQQACALLERLPYGKSPVARLIDLT